MGFFVYVSHRDVVHALEASRQLMKHGHYPFVPHLNRWVDGLPEYEWENHFKMWLFRCDILFCTQSYRNNEVAWARELKMPIVYTIDGMDRVVLPKYRELGRQFGEACALALERSDPNEEWRRPSPERAQIDFEQYLGDVQTPINVAVAALKAWDRGL